MINYFVKYNDYYEFFSKKKENYTIEDIDKQYLIGRLDNEVFHWLRKEKIKKIMNKC